MLRPGRINRPALTHPRETEAMSADPDPKPEPLDEQALTRLRELDPDGRQGVVRRVLTAYETSLARMIAQLQLQTDTADPVIVASIAHTLKSSSASAGALSLAQACADVEARLRGGQVANLRHEIHRLVALAEAAQHSVATILRG
jgi:HPt (histidine-containing phosphotransfer) domain-containing protein